MDEAKLEAAVVRASQLTALSDERKKLLNLRGVVQMKMVAAARGGSLWVDFGWPCADKQTTCFYRPLWGEWLELVDAHLADVNERLSGMMEGA